MTSDTTVVALHQPDPVDDPLTAVLRSGARRLLAQAVEAEAEAFLAEMRGLRLPDGRERLVRHGYGPERLVQTGIGPVPVRRVKLRDRGTGPKGPAARAGRHAALPAAALGRRPEALQPGRDPGVGAAVALEGGVGAGDRARGAGARDAVRLGRR